MKENGRQYDFEGRQRFCRAVAKRGKLEFRPSRAGEEAEIIDLCHRVFGPTLDVEDWRWRNLENPAGESFIQVALEKGGEIIGHMAGVPSDFKIGNSSRKGFLIVDSVVDPAWRGRGVHGALTIELSERFCHHDGAFGFGLPNALAYLPTLKLGTSRVTTVPLFFKILDWKRVLAAGIKSRVLTAALGKVAQLFWPRRAASSDATDLRLEQVQQFGSELDALWERVASDLPVCAVRNATACNWRYFQRPKSPYRIYAASRNGEWQGYIAIRMLQRWGLHLGAVVDLIFDPKCPDAGRLLISKAETELRALGADALWGLFSVPKNYQRLLRRAGFFKTTLARGARPFHLVVDFVTLEHFRSDLSADDRMFLGRGDHWFLSLGDTDLA